MNNTSQLKDKFDLHLFNENGGWFRLWGIIFIILGAMALSTATLTTYISIFFLGILMLASGIVVIMDTFLFWWKKWKGFFLHLFMGILYLSSGLILILNPYIASFTLILLIGILYISLGLIRFFYSVAVQPPKWGWNSFNGILSFLLGLLILINWPSASLYIIGILVGVDLIIAGWVYISASLSNKYYSTTTSTM